MPGSWLQGNQRSPESFLARVFKFLAGFATCFDAAIVAREEDRRRPGLADADGFGVECAQGQVTQWLRSGLPGQPFQELGFAASIITSGHQDVSVAVPGETAYAETAKIELDRITKSSRAAGLNHLCRVEERDDQGLALRNRVPEANEELAIRTRSQTLDVECAAFFRGELRSTGELEPVKPGVSDEISKQGVTGKADGDKGQRMVGDGHLGGEELHSAGPFFAFGVAAMRGNPIHTISYPRSAFEVRFRGVRIHFQETRKVLLPDRLGVTAGGINAEHVVFIIRNRNRAFSQPDGGRSIAHAAHHNLPLRLCRKNPKSKE